MDERETAKTKGRCVAAAASVFLTPAQCASVSGGKARSTRLKPELVSSGKLIAIQSAKATCPRPFGRGLL
jgi:hypothetical protein